MQSIYSVAHAIKDKYGYFPDISIAHRIGQKAEENSFITGMTTCWRVRFDKDYIHEAYYFDITGAPNEYPELYDKIAALLVNKG
ncbi:hypothetical protein NCTGTJJY_CDS0056 [Serratia phage 92A1]|nr:hypothetical protein NCTGTJJY_CDS0056 [Serratia phage 92A1]